MELRKGKKLTEALLASRSVVLSIFLPLSLSPSPLKLDKKRLISLRHRMVLSSGRE